MSHEDVTLTKAAHEFVREFVGHNGLRCRTVRGTLTQARKKGLDPKNVLVAITLLCNAHRDPNRKTVYIELKER